MEMVLDAADRASTKTRIMYKAYLMYAQLKEYLSILVENGLFEHEGEDLNAKQQRRVFA